jgi:eukaryotic-like serine/threonine-protein kinase
LQPGERLASYELLALLGSGGMGAVWKARDPRLSRMVAIKVLREEEHGDLGRLIQEARAAAQLNHPNIVTVHEIGEHDGRVFVVMEFIDGRVLSDTFGSGGMPLKDALKLAIPIVRALEAAHRAGIIHRDLKPNNVMVTAAGDVKLVDFGLAKVIRPMESTESNQATATLLDRPSTAKGQILGTIAYMSPEQAQGKAIDARSDIFSFGTLFYEMLTGRRPFHGQNNVATLASILRDEPPMPGIADPILSRCLRKNPERRFQTAADLRAALEDLREESASRSLAAPTPARRTPVWWWIAGAAAAILAIGAIGWRLSRAPHTGTLAPPQQVTFDGGITATPAISPDGKLLAFASDRGQAGNLDIWLRQTAGGGLVRLTSQPGIEYNPQFSPDGTKLYYLTGSQSIFEMPAIGGPARKVLDDAGPFSVSSKGEIIFCKLMPVARPGPMFIIPAQGGTPEPWHPECKSWPRPAWSEDGARLVFAGDCGQKTHTGFVAPRNGGATEAKLDLPNGPGVLFYAHPEWLAKGSGQEGVIVIRERLVRFDLRSTPSPLLTGAGMPRWPAVSPQGDLAFSSTEELHGVWSLPLDARGPAPESSPSNVVTALGHFSVSRDGKTLVYGRLTGSTAGELVVKKLDGGEEKIFAEHDLLGVSVGSLWPQVSPDGSRIVYRVVGEKGGHYLLRSDTGEARRIAAPEQFQLASDWAPDGKHVVGECAGPRAGICEMDAESGAVKPVLVHATDQLLYPSWSWDGRALAFMRRKPGGPSAIWVAAAAAGGEVAPESTWVQISPPKTDNSRPRFSPEGGMIYYVMGRDGERLLAAQRIEKITHKPVGEVLLPLRTPVDITVLTGGTGPYPLISVSAKRLFYSTVSLRGNLFKTRLD